MLKTYFTRLLSTSRKDRDELLRLLLVAAILVALFWLAETGGDARRRAWALSTGPVLEGQVWRLAAAHFVHLSRLHTFLNSLGILLVVCTIWSVLTPGGLIRAVLASGAAISLGWLLLQPPGPTYVGFSGITHGIFAYGALRLLQIGPRWMGAVVLAGLAAKLGQEFVNGPVPGLEGRIGGSVSLISHALGSLGGALAARRCVPSVRLALIAAAAVAAVSHAEPGLADRLGALLPGLR